MSEALAEQSATFLYQSLVSEAVSISGPKTLLLTGGSCTGKTWILEHIRRAFGSESRMVVSGTTRDEARRIVGEAIDEDKPLLIDDLDDTFDQEMRDTLRRLEAPSRTQKTFMTSTLPPDLTLLRDAQAYGGVDWDAEVLRAWSEVTMTFTTRSIDPWSAGWRRRVADAVMRITGERGAPGWTTLVLHLTGGQPVLLHAALESLVAERVRRGTDSLEESEVSAAEWLRRGAHMEEEVFANGFRRLRHGLIELERRDEAARRHLTEISTGKLEEGILGVAERRSIFMSGVVYRTLSQAFVIAGEIVRHYLADSSEPLIPSIVVSGSGADDRGDLVITVGNERKTIQMGGTSWRMLRVLSDTAGESVSLKQLHVETEIQESAVRSALQRLKAEIQRAGFDGVLENVWGTGYRLGTFPLVVPTHTSD